MESGSYKSEMLIVKHILRSGKSSKVPQNPGILLNILDSSVVIWYQVTRISIRYLHSIKTKRASLLFPGSGLCIVLMFSLSSLKLLY